MCIYVTPNFIPYFRCVPVCLVNYSICKYLCQCLSRIKSNSCIQTFALKPFSKSNLSKFQKHYNDILTQLRMNQESLISSSIYVFLVVHTGKSNFLVSSYLTLCSKTSLELVVTLLTLLRLDFDSAPIIG